MLVSGKMQYVKKLLAIDKQAFIGLHRITGIDFEKEFAILERSGKFTHNSIMKELHNLPFDGDINDSNIYLVYADTRKYSDDKYRIAAVVDSGFDVQRDTIRGYERACGWRWINTLVSKGDFDKIRKSENGHYFIIAQKKEFSCTKEKTVDYNGRFKVVKTHGRIYATPLDKNCDDYYDNICDKGSRGYYYLNSTGYEFDKSGYILGQNNYEQRLRKIRAERSERQAAEYDNTAKLNEFVSRIHIINEILTDKLKNDNRDIDNILEIPYYKIHEVCYNLNWIKQSLKNLKANKFDNMSDINWTLKNIEQHISEAEKKLMEV